MVNHGFFKSRLARIEQAESIEWKGLVLSTLSSLKQVCNHPVQFLKDGSNIEGRSGKVERLFEILEEIIAEGDKALVFTQFAEMGEILQKLIKHNMKTDVFFLHGKVPRKAREEMVEAFQNDKNALPVFILSLKAGGVGLNLTRANKDRLCIFLRGNECSIYDIRPKNCREFPYTSKPDFWSRLINMVQLSGICPVVYEIFRRLKIIYRSEFGRFKRTIPRDWF